MQYQIRTSAGPSAAVGLACVLLATVGFGLNPVFAKLAYATGLSPEAAVLYRFGLPALVLLPFLIREAKAIRPRDLALALGAGGLMGAGTLAYFRALDSLPVTLAAMVYYTYPVFVLALGRLFFAQRLGPRRMAAGGLMLGGAALAIGPSSLAPEQVGALLLVFAAPLAYGLLLNLLSTTLAQMPTLPKTAAAVLGCALVALAFTLRATDGLTPETLGLGYAVIALLALAGMLLPALLLTLGAPIVGATTTGIVSAAELVIAIVAGWAFLGEHATPIQLAGCLLIVVAVMLASLSGKRGAEEPLAH